MGSAYRERAKDRPISSVVFNIESLFLLLFYSLQNSRKMLYREFRIGADLDIEDDRRNS